MNKQMLPYVIEKFAVDVFVKHYWQQRPCIIKQFAPDFCDPIDEHDLAGLAQEPDVDSRIVSNMDGEWQVNQGPFENFEEFCKGRWSLLVQGVDKYIPEIDELSELVAFIPHWRFDDVMVSYSVEGAGVGAHTDQYDVFILQGKGKRRWQVGAPNSSGNTILPHPKLQQVDGFTALIDQELSPGDAVYIPPGHPHKGETLSPCLNYSLGFRTPTNMEALSGILDGLAFEGDKIVEQRYEDPDIAELRDNGNNPFTSNVVCESELKRLKNYMHQLLDSESAENMLMQYLSARSLLNQSGRKLSCSELKGYLNAGFMLERAAGVRAIWREQQASTFQFYIDTHKFSVPSAIQQATIELLNSPAINELPSILNSESEKREWLELLKELVELGFWQMDEH